MIVAQPAHPSATTPICRNDDQIEPVNGLDLEPLLATGARRVIACERFRHKPLMPLFQRRLQENLHDHRVPGHNSRCERFGWNEAGEYLPSFGIWEVYQGLPFGLEEIKKIEPQRDSLDHVLDPVDSSKPAHQILTGYRISSLSKSDDFPFNQEL